MRLMRARSGMYNFIVADCDDKALSADRNGVGELEAGT